MKKKEVKNIKTKKKTSSKVFNDETVTASTDVSLHDKIKRQIKEDENKKRDKIFDNDYNTGNIDSEKLPDIKIDVRYASSNLEECYNMEEYDEKKRLLELTMDVFEKSEWSYLSLTKKFPKELMPFIFNELYNGLENKGFTTIDMFVSIAEFMDITYERVYEIAGLKMKERLIHELEVKYKVLSRKKINKLF